MVSKCANPDCPTEFKYFREGRLYEFTAGEDGSWKSLAEAPGKSARRELFWLCRECAQFYTMTCTDGRLRVVTRERNAA
ncbi:MAG: hypothetical protein ACRD3E_07605 [Terriglobales bacterium]